ncbi:MAG: hypothetical protein JWN61_3077 [Pseudonocardiales bacterium]|nr:hypothetical protein [Pseudonocardiales bacterium]
MTATTRSVEPVKPSGAKVPMAKVPTSKVPAAKVSIAKVHYGRIAIRAIASLGCAAVLLVVLPRVVGTHWGEVGDVLRSLSATDVLMLSGVWALGLFAYTLVQAAALPGLGHGRALMLNLAGSMVANAVPLGGLVSISVNLAMVRSWALTTASFIRFAALTQLLNVLTKLALPAVALTMVCFTDLVPGPSLVWAAVGSVSLLVIAVAGIAAIVGADRAAIVAGGLLQPAVSLLWRMLRRPAAPDTRGAASELRSRIADLLRDGWRRMAFGLVAYSALQFLLFALALRMVGSSAPLVALFAAFAVERAFTLVPITPGGVGIAETMSTLLLVALGADPVISAAGVVLYRAFAFFFEMPFGFVALVGWWARRGRRGSVDPLPA